MDATTEAKTHRTGHDRRIDSWRDELEGANRLFLYCNGSGKKHAVKVVLS
jgi:hypothetical protein